MIVHSTKHFVVEKKNGYYSVRPKANVFSEALDKEVNDFLDRMIERPFHYLESIVLYLNAFESVKLPIFKRRNQKRLETELRMNNNIKE